MATTTPQTGLQIQTPIIPANCDVKALALRQESTKIANYTQPEFKAAELRLLGISKTLGISKVPEPEDIIVIVKFIRSHFSEFSIEEVSYAFELYCAMKISVDVESFNSFNIRFVAKVLVAYRIYRKGEVRKQESFEVKRLEEAGKPTEEERERELFAGLVRYYNTEKDMPIAWDYNAVFNHLFRIGKVLITPDETKALRERVKALLAAEALQQAQTQTGIKIDLSSFSRVDAVNYRMRKEYVKQFIQDGSKDS